MTSAINKTEQGLAISGKLVYSTVADLSELGNQVIAESNQNTVDIDCQSMERIDSAGIALLLQWQRESKVANKACRFVNLSDQAKSLIQAYQLQTVIAA